MENKKIISCALAVMLSLGTLTVLPEQFSGMPGIAITAEAASNDLVIVKDSDGYKYVDGYKGKGGDVVIPKDVSYINSNAFEGVTNITSITAKGDLYVWNGAFTGCTKLQKVVVEGDAYFEQSAFYMCASLESVEIKGGIDEVIGGSAFAYCTSLRSFKVNGSKYDYDIGEQAFYNCINLKNVDIASSCNNIYNEAFLNCVNLDSLTIPSKTKFYSSKGSKHVGYTYAYKTEDDFYDGNLEYFFNNGSTPVYIYYPSFDIPLGRYWDTDFYGLYGNLERFNPRKITLTVTKGSNAESFAKKNGIAYKYASATSDEELASPENIRASAKTKNSITLKWNKVAGADAYTVYMYNASTGKYEKYKTVTSNSCTITKLKKNTKYKFKVVALEKVNGKYKEGEKSDPVAITTKKK